jgi:hypothetical protein
MSLLDSFVRDIASQAKRVVIGFPSDGTNGKATGLHYSIDWYLKESVNNSRSEKHKVVAKIAAEVLANPELHEFIGTLVEKAATEMVKDGYAKSGLKDEDNEQAKNDVKIVVPKTTKVAVKKPTTKKAPAKSTTTKAKPTARKTRKVAAK